MNQKSNSLLIPIEVSKFVIENGLIRPFAIYLYLKFYKGGKVSACDEIFSSLRKDLKMTDSKKRTFRKHFEKLLTLNWVGFNPVSNIYHIRGLDYIRAVNGFKKRNATKLYAKDLGQLQVYLAGAIICNKISNQEYFWERVKGRSRTATKRDVAKQSRASRHSSQPYYGLCNKRIARLLGCKYTRACNLKQAAAEAGYITLRKHYADIKELDKADYQLRPMLAEQLPELAKKMRFWRQKKGEQKIVKVVKQLYDEIIPHIEYKRVAGFAALKVPFGIIKGFLAKQRHEKAAFLHTAR